MQDYGAARRKLESARSVDAIGDQAGGGIQVSSGCTVTALALSTQAIGALPAGRATRFCTIDGRERCCLATGTPELFL